MTELQPRKRKIKIDYRSKQIQEEIVDSSESEEEQEVINKTRRHQSRTNHRVNTIQDTHDDNEQRKRAYNSSISQERPRTNQGHRSRNYQNYRTQDPSEAFSQKQMMQERDIPSANHREEEYIGRTN